MKSQSLGSSWKQQATTDAARPRGGEAAAWPVDQRPSPGSPAQPGTGRPRRGSETRRLRYALRGGPGALTGFAAGRAGGAERVPPAQSQRGSRGRAQPGAPHPPQDPARGPDGARPCASQGGLTAPLPPPAAPAAGRLRAEAAAPAGRRGRGAGGHRAGRETRPGGRGRDTPVAGRRWAPSARTAYHRTEVGSGGEAPERRQGSARTHLAGATGAGRSRQRERAARGWRDGADGTGPAARAPPTPAAAAASRCRAWAAAAAHHVTGQGAGPRRALPGAGRRARERFRRPNNAVPSRRPGLRRRL